MSSEKRNAALTEKVAPLRRSAQMIVSLLTGPKVRPSEVSEAEGRASELAEELYAISAEIRQEQTDE